MKNLQLVVTPYNNKRLGYEVRVFDGDKAIHGWNTQTLPQDAYYVKQHDIGNGQVGYTVNTKPYLPESWGVARSEANV